MESKMDNIVTKRGELQDIKINQLKFKINDFYEKDDNITTNFELCNDEDVLHNAYRKLFEKYRWKIKEKMVT